MMLEQALHLLATIHTRDNNCVGFLVEMRVGPPFSVPFREYCAAWKVVREAAHMTTRPENAMPIDQPPAIIEHWKGPEGARCVVIGSDPALMGTYDAQGRCVLDRNDRMVRPAGIPESVPEKQDGK